MKVEDLLAIAEARGILEGLRYVLDEREAEALQLALYLLGDIEIKNKEIIEK